jgi:hypothetical protein
MLVVVIMPISSDPGIEGKWSEKPYKEKHEIVDKLVFLKIQIMNQIML